MPGVFVPSAKQGQVEGAMPMIGAAVGGAFGGPAGAAVGGKIGGSLAGKPGDPGAVQSTAISRRIDTTEGDPSAQLARADSALQQLPPEYQQQYGPVIAAARQRDAMGGV